jgi:hypothetical protein
MGTRSARGAARFRSSSTAGVVIDVLRGWREYGAHPERRTSWGGPFNGQSGRRALWGSLMADFRPLAIVETGSYRGTTTEYLGRAGLPVFTVEYSPRNFAFVLRRFWRHRDIKVFLGDSRTCLRRLFGGQLRRFLGGVIAFYLDAHWGGDLPLAEEIEIIFGLCPKAVVVVDDFEVPGDPGYGFDDYGPGRRLTDEYIAHLVRQFDLMVAYPVMPSSEEDGSRRGCVVLVTTDEFKAKIKANPLLRVGRP